MTDIDETSKSEGPGLPVEVTVVSERIQQQLACFAKRAGFYAANHLTKAGDELAELRDAPADPAEMADVVLAIMLHADQHGVDLLEACRKKLAAVTTRRYGLPDSRGVVRHLVSPPAPRYDEVFEEGVKWLRSL